MGPLCLQKKPPTTFGGTTFPVSSNMELSFTTNSNFLPFHNSILPSMPAMPLCSPSENYRKILASHQMSHISVFHPPCSGTSK